MEELGSDVRFEIGEFLNYLRGSWLDDRIGGQAHDIDFSNLIYTSSRYDWISGISLEFSGSDTYATSVPVGLSQVVEGIGPAYTDREVTIDVDFAFTLSLGWDDSTGATYDFQVTRLELDASFDSPDLVIPFLIGGLRRPEAIPSTLPGQWTLRPTWISPTTTNTDEYQVTYDPVSDSGFEPGSLPACLRVPCRHRRKPGPAWPRSPCPETFSRRPTAAGGLPPSRQFRRTSSLSRRLLS